MAQVDQATTEAPPRTPGSVTLNGEELTRETALVRLRQELKLVRAVGDVLDSGDFGADDRPSIRRVREIVDEEIALFESELATEVPF